MKGERVALAALALFTASCEASGKIGDFEFLSHGEFRDNEKGVIFISYNPQTHQSLRLDLGLNANDELWFGYKNWITLQGKAAYTNHRLTLVYKDRTIVVKSSDVNP